jgi:hypothetical protein
MSRLVEEAARFMGAWGDTQRRPLTEGQSSFVNGGEGTGLTRQSGLTRPMNDPYHPENEIRTEDERPKSVMNIIHEQREKRRYGSFGDSRDDALLTDTRRLMTAQATARSLYERKAQVEDAIALLEGTDFERQLDEEFDGRNRSTLRPGGGYAQGVEPAGNVINLQGRQSTGAYGGNGNSPDLFDPEQTERLAKLAAYRRDAERQNVEPNSNLGGGNFSQMADRFGSKAAQHSEPYRAGNAADGNRSLARWMMQHLDDVGGREDVDYHDTHMGWEEPLVGDDAYDEMPHPHTIDTDAGLNAKAFGRATSAADARSRRYQFDMQRAGHGQSYGDDSYDNENPNQRARNQGYERSAY